MSFVVIPCGYIHRNCPAFNEVPNGIWYAMACRSVSRVRFEGGS